MAERHKKSILVITGARADYGLLRPIMREIAQSDALELRVLVTGMHTLTRYGHTEDLVRADGMPVVVVVPVSEDDEMTDALAAEIRGIGEYCRAHRPDLILVLGDRDESFAGAIVGGHLGIPVAHVHGGDKTGPAVDEYIRHATTKFSHIHFPATKKSAQRIKLLGEEPWRIVMVGGPGLDELRTVPECSRESLAQRYGLLSDKPWHVVLHNPTPLDPVPYRDQISPLLRVMGGLDSEKIVIYPNSDTGSDVFIAELEAQKDTRGVHLFRNLPREDLINTLRQAEFLAGNSSMGIIDCSFLKLPVVNVGNRQAMRERGSNVVDCGYAEEEIRAAISKVTAISFRHRMHFSKSPYGDGHAAERIVRELERLMARSDLLDKQLTYK